jgi:hypothetical protein
MNDRTPLRFFVFTCRDPRSDFRLPLVQVLMREYETWYVWVKRRPVITGPHASAAPAEMSFAELLDFMRKTERGGKIPVYFMSTNALFPGVMALLRLVSPPGLWCLDMHDDLLYNYRGFKRLRAWVAIRALRKVSDITVHAADTLRELFPDSHHLGNASQIGRLERSASPPRRLLILASVDERFDFELMARAARACPTFAFEIHGQVLAFARARLDRLLAEHANVRYEGPYVNADLPALLSRYRVTFAPYVTDDRATRYIDPLRFYHCLNSGMEVVTTDIPQARALGHALHIIHDEQELRSILDEDGRVRSPKQPFYTPMTWERRAAGLLEILRDAPRMRGLRRKFGLA